MNAGAVSRRVTIVDVARAAGVSRQTVSRAMNDMDGIGAATKTKVLDVAQQLGYRPSRFGRGLVRGSHQTIGLLIDNLSNPYYSEVASAVVDCAAKRGWTVLLLDADDREHQSTLLTQLADQIDALVGYINVAPQVVETLLPGVPIVRLDAAANSGYPATITFEHRRAMTALAAHLAERGVTCPVALDGEPTLTARTADFVQAMAKQGYGSIAVHPAGDTFDSGQQAIRTVVEQNRGVDAVFCFNDVIAFGALRGLHQLGKEIPGDVRVIGFDGVAAGAYVTPQLTTLSLDLRAAAAAAVDIALGMIAGDVTAQSRQARRRVSRRLLVRESS